MNKVNFEKILQGGNKVTLQEYVRTELGGNRRLVNSEERYATRRCMVVTWPEIR